MKYTGSTQHARTKQARMTDDGALSVGLLYTLRIAREVKRVRRKFDGRIGIHRLTIEKFCAAGPRTMIPRKNNKMSVRSTEVYLTLPSEYPFAKPKLFFTDTDVDLASLDQSGQYMDNIKWSPSMNVTLFLNCVRHEILASSGVIR